MRLDHLLSKEHFLPGFGLVRGQFIGERPVLVAHGWNVDYSARLVGTVSTASAWNTVWIGRVGHAVGYLRVRTSVLIFAMPAPVHSFFGAG